MKQKRRYRRKTKGDGLVSSWPEECDEPEQLAQRVAYVGSAEHKARPVDPSFRIEPDLRSDASKCPTDIDRDNAKRVLREALQRRCVSQSFESGFPRYAWGWLDGTPYVARLTNREKGAYKGWPIEPFELPTDREGRLDRAAWSGDHDD